MSVWRRIFHSWKTTMTVFLSVIALVTIFGHLLSTFKSRAYWPFDYYPMYSLPFDKLIYPIVQGNHLTLFCLMDASDPQNTVDLMSGPDVFPPSFHPLDRLNISYLMLFGLNLSSQDQFKNKQRMEDAGRSVLKSTSPTQTSLQDVLQCFIQLASENNRTIKKMQVVQLEWKNFRDANAHYLKPDSVTIVGEALARNS